MEDITDVHHWIINYSTNIPIDGNSHDHQLKNWVGYAGTCLLSPSRPLLFIINIVSRNAYNVLKRM